MKTLIPVLVLTVAAVLHASPPEKESFEGERIPETWTAREGELSLAADKLIDGKQSLRWTPQNGSSLQINMGPLGNTNVYAGYAGYSRSALVLPICLTERDRNAKLHVELRSGEQTAASFDVPFAHVGWQKIVLHYTWKTQMKWAQPALRGKIDNMRITASGLAKASPLYIDAIAYNTPQDFREGVPPVTEDWSPRSFDFSNESQPGQEQLASLDRLCSMLAPQPDPKPSREHWQKQLESIRSTIAKEQYSKDHPVTKKLADYFGFLNRIADQWNKCPDPELKDGFAKEFASMNSWLQEQGLVVNGAQGKANNYIGRLYVDAATKMRDVLLKNGTLETTLNYLKWAYDYDDKIFGEPGAESMDYLHNDAHRILRIAASHPDPIERWHHVNRFRGMLSRQLVLTIKPDGSLFHHGFHYFAYGKLGIDSISQTLNTLSNAGLPVSREALDAAKRGVMQMRWYCGGVTALLSICGRHATGTQYVPKESFLRTARAYMPYLDGKPDEELISAYLRLVPGEASKYPGIHPETELNGFSSMPYAGLGLHRRGTWLAGVKGYGKYVCSGESYDKVNRFGLYLSNGFLELHTHPVPLPNVRGSGCRTDSGWNWCALDGTTTIHGPLANIANSNRTRMPRSPETFVGGLSHDGRNGLFVLKLNDREQANVNREKGTKGNPFQALKTWYFFDNHILCLGSDISVNQVPYPVRTTLFQKFLDKGHDTASVNGRPVKYQGKPAVIRLKNGRSLLTDPYGNAYITTKGDPVQLTIGKQQSRDGYDRRDTEGNYATAWIDHGINPEGASYEYSVLVQPDNRQMAAWNSEIPYVVLKKDREAHVVRFNKHRTFAYVISDAAWDVGSLKTPLAHVQQPCLVMIEIKTPGRMLVSLTDPDLREKEKTAKPVAITLQGKWASREMPQGSSITYNGNDTILSVPVIHAESVTVALEKAAP